MPYPSVSTKKSQGKNMKDYKSLSHTRWDCKYYVVFILKKRKKIIYGSLRNYLGKIIHEPAKYIGIEILEGH